MLGNKILGYRLKKIRNEKEITQKKLAEFLEVSQSTINAWETGRQEPSFQKITSICKYLNITPDYLYGFDYKTREYIKMIKNDDSLTNSNSPLSEEDKNWAKDIIAEIKDDIKKFKATKDNKYLHYTTFLEDDLDSLIMEHKKFRDYILNINYEDSHRTPLKLNDNKLSAEQKELLDEIKNLSDENCKRVKDFITGILIAEEEKQKIINMYKRGE